MAKRTRRAYALLRATTLVALGALACSDLLSIEEAHVDPALSAGAGAGLGSGGQSARGGAGAEKGGNASVSGGNAATGGNAGNATGGNETGGDVGTGGVSEGGSTGSDAGAAGAGGTESLCEQYCDVITQYCTAGYLQYKDREQCIKVCSLLPEGAVGGPEGNSVACRLKYAGKARYAGGTELGAYCRQAGPGGDGRCGSNCEGFCSVTMATCTQQDTSPYYYESTSACQTTCQTLPNVPYVYGDVSVADGNSVQCRLFHVISAAMADPEEHCEHAMGITLCESAR